mgnify:CR=1 FL=1
MTKTALDRAIEHHKMVIASKRFSWSKIKWLLSLYDGREPDNKEISSEDYFYIKSIQSQQSDKMKRLSEEQLSICNKIYERYQSVDVR